LLVKAWGLKTVNWGFPRGKINKDETELKCAIREVLEEVGFNIEGRVNENDYFEATVSGHKVRMYVVPGVSESTCFATNTRNEIAVGLSFVFSHKIWASFPSLLFRVVAEN